MWFVVIAPLVFLRQRGKQGGNGDGRTEKLHADGDLGL
jgi:hypothetical protein